MNIVILVGGCLLLFQGYCESQETEEIFNDELTSNAFSFPKDRITSPTTRIIGGAEATLNSYPFQVAIYVTMSSKSYFCGGTLISPTWVLTAAHCLSDDPLYATVLLGAHNLSADEPNRISLTSTSFVVHEGWDSSTLQNDIALVRLPANVTLTTYVGTITYATDDQTYDNQVGTIIGWGLTETGGDTISSVLKHVNTSVLDNTACASTDTDYRKVVVSSHLCTSGVGIVGSCGGDSGGPLVINGVQVGIVSFGSTDCTSGKPSVFTRVTHFSDWIANYVTGSCDTYRNVGYTLVSSIAISLSNYLFYNKF